MQKMSQQLDQQNENHKDLSEKVAVEFQTVRNEIAKSVEESTRSFEKTLEYSLRRQDNQLQSAFSELKAIMQASPIPSKKAKVTKPAEKTEEEEKMDL